MLKDSEMPHTISPLVLKIKALKDIGYDHDFMICPDGLKDEDSGKIYKPEDIKIIDHFRFEGISDPDDMSILYTIISKEGVKGTVIDAFGTYSNRDLMGFMKQVKDENKSNL
jgi:hypothetical protein